MEPPVIELRELTKHFGGVTALDGVGFGITRGEVHAVVGENGAGKSTLMKLLAGVHQPDRGEIRLDGQAVALTSPRVARQRGISIVFQELNLFPHRTVAANVFANRELASGLGWTRVRAMREATAEALEEMNVRLSPDAPVGSLSLGEQQLVEITRAIQERSRILILDEPNSSLTEAESQRLFTVLRQLRQSGVTILYVSHRLEEVFAIADRITVVRDGRWQGTDLATATTISEVVALMIGRRAPCPDIGGSRRRVEGLHPNKTPTSAPVLLQVRNLCQGHRLGPVSFSVRSGEILGFAGREGAGISHLFQTLFGITPATSGQVIHAGEPVEGLSPWQRLRRGLALVPASRREEGLMMDWPVSRNTTFLILEKLLAKLGLIRACSIERSTHQAIQRFGIVPPRPDYRASQLSGGNQQKVLLAKWLAPRPTVLLLDDPTRGVDVGAKEEIAALCRELAAEGLAILMTSSELDEVIAWSDRICVFLDGRLRGEFSQEEATKGRIMEALNQGGVNVPCLADQPR